MTTPETISKHGCVRSADLPNNVKYELSQRHSDVTSHVSEKGRTRWSLIV